MKFILAVLFVVGLCFSAKACEGHYETRYQSVCVCQAHYASSFVPPVYNACGQCVQGGYYAQVYVPAHYATQAVSVYVQDAPVCGYGYGGGYGYRAPVYAGPYVGGSPWFAGPYRRW